MNRLQLSTKINSDFLGREEIIVMGGVWPK